MNRDKLIETVAEAMKDRATTWGGLTKWDELAEAALTAIEEVGYIVVPSSLSLNKRRILEAMCQADAGAKGETVSAPAEPLQADLVAEASENHQWQPEVKWKPMDDEILAKLTWLTEQGVEWGSTGAQTDEEHVEQFRKTLQETHAHFNTTEPRELHGVYLKGTETVICHTGTSPNSPMFARIITGLIMSALRIHNNLAKAANSQTQIKEPANAGDEVTAASAESSLTPINQDQDNG